MGRVDQLDAGGDGFPNEGDVIRRVRQPIRAEANPRDIAAAKVERRIDGSLPPAQPRRADFEVVASASRSAS
jgi:hypothetical protein